MERTEAEINFFGGVVGGSLSGDLEIRLDPDVPQETIKVGRLVVVEGERYFYFGIVSDVALGATGPEVLSAKPDLSRDLIRRSLLGTNLTADATVRPMLAIPKEVELDGKAVPVYRTARRTPDALAALRSALGPARSLPPHFAPARLADKPDVDLVFGAEEEDRAWLTDGEASEGRSARSDRHGELGGDPRLEGLRGAAEHAHTKGEPDLLDQPLPLRGDRLDLGDVADREGLRGQAGRARRRPGRP